MQGKKTNKQQVKKNTFIVEKCVGRRSEMMFNKI